ncbi:hypothetical protein [Nocardioides jensenii]|uniref:hypothetical protein n=1 Tax=Nocardioides jensenii TaxID=1843 RepID=UPI00082D15C2|nr:hypothetical protein [Nocardioides jensenii]
MSIPTRTTLQVRRRQDGPAKDSHGNPVITYADPISWPVFGYAPGASDRTTDPNRDLSLILWTVYAPAGGNAPGELDRVLLGGTEYDIETRPDDWTHGPWAHPTAGLVVELKRAEG